jgi:hypothetical protein
MFPRNEGVADRITRAAVGTALLALSVGLGARSKRPLGLGAGLMGTVLLLTAATGSCQLYRPFGIDTARQG